MRDRASADTLTAAAVGGAFMTLVGLVGPASAGFTVPLIALSIASFVAGALTAIARPLDLSAPKNGPAKPALVVAGLGTAATLKAVLPALWETVLIAGIGFGMGAYLLTSVVIARRFTPSRIEPG